jgi:hypothetical protein
MVAGNLPVTGQTVEYGLARYTGADGSALATNATVPFDATSQGNLSWNSTNNRFTLKANKTYEIESYLAVYLYNAGVAGVFQIYNFTNSFALASGLFLSMDGSGGVYHPNANGPMRCIVTPTTDIEVGVRLTTSYGGSPGIIGSTNTLGSNAAPNQSYLLVKQIGSSAIVDPWVLSGNNTYNTTGNVGIGTNAPTQALDVTGNLNVTGKINLTDPTGNVTTKAAAIVGRGVDVTLGNLKARMAASGNASLQVSTGSGSYNVYGSFYYVAGGVGSGTIDGATPLAITTTPKYLRDLTNFNGAGQIDNWIIMDTANTIAWRITLIVGAGLNNNFISIERLL